jgi:two-component system cell cycle response regulator
MTALILVVDDLEPNVKLLEAKLAAEYYDIITASDGYKAIEMAKQHSPDLILLDVMMPGMDGFTACRQLKSMPETAHIPVVMVTALSEPSDRVQGLQSGADDFLTKPINDVQLLARVRSLLRMKQLIDELRLRGQTSSEIGEVTGINLTELGNIHGSNILLVDDDVVEGRNIIARLEAEGLKVSQATSAAEATQLAGQVTFDLTLISTQLMDSDGLRLCSQFRSQEITRHIPQIIMVDEHDTKHLVKGLEMGVNDYLMSPVDVSEMACRVRTNIRRKKYQDALKASYQQTVTMAIKDNLTGIYNRHYLEAHLKNLAASSLDKAKPLSALMMDMDYFKSVNDGFGHDVGDEILRQLAQRISSQLRASDMVARFGGEEFVVVLPGAPLHIAREVAERIRITVESTPFAISHPQGQLFKTVSIGTCMLEHYAGAPEGLVDELIKGADEALYKAKHNGRNRVIVAGLPDDQQPAPGTTPTPSQPGNIGSMPTTPAAPIAQAAPQTEVSPMQSPSPTPQDTAALPPATMATPFAEQPAPPPVEPASFIPPQTPIPTAIDPFAHTAPAPIVAATPAIEPLAPFTPATEAPPPPPAGAEMPFAAPLAQAAPQTEASAMQFPSPDLEDTAVPPPTTMATFSPPQSPIPTIQTAPALGIIQQDTAENQAVFAPAQPAAPAPAFNPPIEQSTEPSSLAPSFAAPLEAPSSFTPSAPAPSMEAPSLNLSAPAMATDPFAPPSGMTETPSEIAEAIATIAPVPNPFADTPSPSLSFAPSFAVQNSATAAASPASEAPSLTPAAPSASDALDPSIPEPPQPPAMAFGSLPAEAPSPSFGFGHMPEPTAALPVPSPFEAAPAMSSVPKPASPLSPFGQPLQESTYAEPSSAVETSGLSAQDIETLMAQPAETSPVAASIQAGYPAPTAAEPQSAAPESFGTTAFSPPAGDAPPTPPTTFHFGEPAAVPHSFAPAAAHPFEQAPAPAYHHETAPPAAAPPAAPPAADAVSVSMPAIPEEQPKTRLSSLRPRGSKPLGNSPSVSGGGLGEMLGNFLPFLKKKKADEPTGETEDSSSGGNFDYTRVSQPRTDTSHEGDPSGETRSSFGRKNFGGDSW